MTTVLVDTSVLIKWFDDGDEPELDAARVIRDANSQGAVEARIIDLGLHEVGNVLLKRQSWRPQDVADQLDDLLIICGAPILLIPAWLREAATLARKHSLTFYDAAWAATARALGVPLVSADNRLVGAGLALSPASAVRHLHLS